MCRICVKFGNFLSDLLKEQCMKEQCMAQNFCGKRLCVQYGQGQMYMRPPSGGIKSYKTAQENSLDPSNVTFI